ncbi:DNA polymerase V, partial [Escherichia coli]
MARRYEIPGAFTAAIKKAPNGLQTVSTQDFVTQLAKVNWHWSLHEANKWIEHYVTTFKDISP